MAEAEDLKSLCWGFESLHRYQFMRKFEEILSQCRQEANEHYDAHIPTFQGITTRDEAVIIFGGLKRLDKMKEMYNILTMLESYLSRPSCDGRIDRSEMRKKLKELLDSL